MTAPDTTRRAGPFNGNGSTTSHPFEFKVFAATDIAVVLAGEDGIETTQVLDSDYTVTVNADQDSSPGGTVAMSTAPAVGESLVIIGAIPNDQTLDLPNGGAYSPRALENALDRTTFQIQQLAEEMGRSLTLPATSAGASTALPVPAANKAIGWNPQADGLVNLDVAALLTSTAFANWVPESFTGDGARTQFVLAGVPGSIGNIDVAVGGVTQTATEDYSLSGNVLTFTTAPGSGVRVFVRYGSAAVQGTTSFVSELKIATAGQTEFTTTVAFTPGAGNVKAYVDGLRVTDYAETDSNTITFTSPLAAGQEVLLEIGRQLSDGVQASQVSIQRAGGVATPLNLWSQYRPVSVFDFLTAAQIADVQSGAQTLNLLTPIQNAINASYGKRLIFPKGSYRIEGSLNIITNGIEISGEQFGNVTIYQHTDNTPHLKIGDGTLGNRVTRATVENLQFLPRAGSANWTTAYAIEASYAGFLNIVNCEVYGQDGSNYRIYGGIKFDRVSFSNIYDCWVRGIKGTGIYTVGASGNLTADIRIMNTYVLGFEGNGLHFSDYTNGHFIVNGEIVTSVGQNGVYVDSNPANGGVNFFFTNLNMELSGGTCDGVTLNRGSLIQFQDGWWGASAGKSAVRIASGVSNVTFNGPWTTEGRWSIEGTNVKVHGPGNIGTLAPAASAAVSIVGATASLVDIKDMAISQFTGGGIEATGTPTDVSIEGNDFTLLGGGTPISGTLGARSQVTNNRGDTTRGAAAAISVGASPFTYTTGRRPESVHITGGTVSAIVVNGVTLAAATNHAVQLPPNASVTVTYSSAPTMVSIPQ